MAKKFIDEQGLRTLWNQSKDKFVSKESLELKKYNLNMNGADWITLAKVTDVSLNSSALFSINCYGVKEQNRTILTTSVFNISVGLDEDKNIISSVLPISQTPEIQLSGDSGSSSVGSGGSGNSAVYGLSNIAFEKYDENTIYVMGLISFPATDQYDSLDVEMRLDDNLNFEYLESLDVVYKQEDDTLQEGTQIYVEGDYVNYYMRDSLDLIQQYIDSVGTYNSETYGYVLYKREDGNLGQDVLMYKTSNNNNLEYYICGIYSTIDAYSIVKDYEKFRNQETISIPIQLGVEFNLFNILKEYIDDEVINDLGKGYKVELHKFYNPTIVKMNYNGLGDDYSFIIEEVGRSQSAILLNSSNYQLRSCDKNTLNYIINAYDSLGEKLEEGTIYLNIEMVPGFFYVDFIFNYLNQFPNGQKLEITRVNWLPLRYMGDTKVENYSQSYELYNPYKRLDMLADGNMVVSINDFYAEEDNAFFDLLMPFNNYAFGIYNWNLKKASIPKQVYYYPYTINLYQSDRLSTQLEKIFIELRDKFGFDYLYESNFIDKLPLIICRNMVVSISGTYAPGIIIITDVTDPSDGDYQIKGAIIASCPSNTTVVEFCYNLTIDGRISKEKYASKKIYYPPDITTDENGNVTDISIKGTSISTKDYTDATFVPISSSSTDSTVGDSTLSNTNGEILINTNKSGYKVETKSSGANLTVEAGLVTGTPTTTVKVNPNGVTINDEKVATEPYVEEAVANLVNSAPEALNTLKELSTALGDDPNFAATVANQIGNKVPIENHSAENQAIFSRVENNGDDIKLMSRKGATENNLNISWENGVTVNGEKIATDNNVVHKTGDDWNIAGTKQWDGNHYFQKGVSFNANVTTNAQLIANNQIVSNKSITQNYGGILGGYLDLHPEANYVALPFYMNDLAFLQKKGGSCTITGFATGTDVESIFNGKSDYSYYTVTNTTDIVTILIKSYKNFGWINKIGISFGSANWRAKSIKIELGYATEIGGVPADDAWVIVGEETDYIEGTYFTNRVYGPTTGNADSKLWNTIRITLTNFNTLNVRIAGIFAINMNSEGLPTTLLSKNGGDVYGHIYPYSDGTINLGLSSKRWSDVYCNLLDTKYVLPKGGDGNGTIGNSTNKWKGVYSNNIITNYFEPTNGHNTGGIGASDKYWNTIYVSNVKCNSVQEGGVLLKNKYIRAFNVRLGRNGTTNAVRVCSFCTMTFDQNYAGYEFEILITNKESKTDVAKYFIKGRSANSITNIRCDIKKIFSSDNIVQVFAVQSNNILTFYVRTYDSYNDINISVYHYDIDGNVSYEFKAGTWTETIPEATFTETYILDKRYLTKTGGFVSGSIFPDTTEIYNLGSNSNRFSYVYSRILNASNVEGNFIFPRTTGTGSVGTPEFTYNLMYANNYYENGVKLEDKYVPITASSSTSGVGDSTLSNSNGEVLISTNKQGYKVETKSSGANLTVEAGLVTGTPTTSFKVNPNGVYINDEQIATKKYQHNIHLTGAVDSTGVTRAIITFSFINNVSTAYTTVRGNLDTALYNAGFNSSTKLCNASGNFIPNASSNYSAMGVSGSSASGITVYGNYGQTSNGNLTLGTATAIIGYYNVTVTDTVIEI